MAADEPQGRRASRGLDSSALPRFDPSLDRQLRQLFQRQAETQAEIAALLAAKYVPNSKLELGMLRLKLGALETYATQQS